MKKLICFILLSGSLILPNYASNFEISVPSEFLNPQDTLKRKLKIGMGQILVEPGHPTENLQRAKKAIEEAAKYGCDIIVLPECMDLGWTFPGAPELANLFQVSTVMCWYRRLWPIKYTLPQD